MLVGNEAPGATGLLIVSGLFGTIALMRVGMRHFWTAQDRPAPRLRVIETLPIAGLLAASMALVLQADAGLAYSRAAADSLHAPRLYIDAVMGARPVARSSGAAP